ncbi:MAG: guanylate kinase [bacterium]
MKFNPSNLIIITGPSGVGKTSAALKLLKKHKNIKRLVTYTTRPRRPGERNGRDYNFVSAEKFKKMLDDGELFEHAEVYGNYYGNRLADLKNICEKNKFCLTVLDIQGAEKIKKEFSKSKGIFLTADFKELARRLIKRGKMKKDDFALRQKIAKKEMANARRFDYTVENKHEKLKETVEEIEKILKKISA